MTKTQYIRISCRVHNYKIKIKCQTHVNGGSDYLTMTNKINLQLVFYIDIFNNYENRKEYRVRQANCRILRAIRNINKNELLLIVIFCRVFIQNLFRIKNSFNLQILIFYEIQVVIKVSSWYFTRSRSSLKSHLELVTT